MSTSAGRNGKSHYRKFTWRAGSTSHTVRSVDYGCNNFFAHGGQPAQNLCNRFFSLTQLLTTRFTTILVTTMSSYSSLLWIACTYTVMLKTIFAAPAGRAVVLGQQFHEKHHKHNHRHSTGVEMKLLSLFGPPEAGDANVAEAFPLTATRLADDSTFGVAQQLNTAFLRMLNLDRLLFQFRIQSGAYVRDVHLYACVEISTHACLSMSLTTVNPRLIHTWRTTIRRLGESELRYFKGYARD